MTTDDLVNSMIFLSVCAFISTLTSIFLIDQLSDPIDPEQNKKSNSRSKTSKIKLLIISCVLISTLCTWSDLIRHIICWLLNKPLCAYPMNNILSFADLLYYLGSILFYLIAINRVQYSFKTTMYELSYCTVSFFYILIFISFILSLYYTIIVAMTPKDNPGKASWPKNFWTRFDTIPLITIGIIDFILNTSLLILFISKLKQLLSSKLLNIDLYKQRNRNHRIYKTSSNLLLLMTRHTILFGFATITNQIWYITVILKFYIFPHFGYKDVNWHITNFCFRAIENTANCLVLFLSLQKNLKLYLFCCGCCHWNIQKCFVNGLKSQINSMTSANKDSSNRNNEDIMSCDNSSINEFEEDLLSTNDLDIDTTNPGIQSTCTPTDVTTH